MSTTKEYRDYIKSEEWAAIRVELLSQRGTKCERCGNSPKRLCNLHIHHLNYERLFNEEPEDLEILCKRCHYNEHSKKKKKRSKKKRKKINNQNPWGLSKNDRSLQKRYDQIIGR